MSILDRAEQSVLAILITVAGAWVAAGIVAQHIGHAIDRACAGWRI